jgi:uncharacterized protein
VLIRALFLPHLVEREREGFELDTRHKVAAVLVGVFVGFVLGITSAGSGSLIAIALIMIFRLVPRRVVGTDVFHAALLLWAAAIAHIVAGNVDYGLAGNILVGSIPGVYLGSHWSVRVPMETLRLALGIVLLGAGLGLASKAGANIPAPVIAAAPVALLALLLRQQWLRRRTPAPSPEEPQPAAAPAAPSA